METVDGEAGGTVPSQYGIQTVLMRLDPCGHKDAKKDGADSEGNRETTAVGPLDWPREDIQSSADYSARLRSRFEFSLYSLDLHGFLTSRTMLASPQIDH